jgi:hypothetical protein
MNAGDIFRHLASEIFLPNRLAHGQTNTRESFAVSCSLLRNLRLDTGHETFGLHQVHGSTPKPWGECVLRPKPKLFPDFLVKNGISYV